MEILLEPKNAKQEEQQEQVNEQATEQATEEKTEAAEGQKADALVD